MAIPIPSRNTEILVVNETKEVRGILYAREGRPGLGFYEYMQSIGYTGTQAQLNLAILNLISGTGNGGTGDGRQVELQATATHIQWRYVGDPTWINLIALSELQGAPGYTPVKGEDYDDGREVEFQSTETHIQWRYVGETSWNNLISLSEITGAAGKSVELQATATHIQWRQIGDSEWTDIVPLSTLKGADGTNITITATTDQAVYDNATPSASELVVLYDA